MPATYKKIASVTVTASTAAAIEFTSIPATYTDLVIKTSLRSTNASINPGLLININGNNTGLSTRLLYGDGSAAASYTATDEIGTPAGDNATASTFGNAEIYFPNYAGSTNKSFSVDTVNENNATSATQYLTAGLRSNTDAITSILLKPASSASFKQYSTATLYGIRKT